jgi:hypothetical protein
MQVAGLAVLILPELRYALTGQDYDPYLAWWLGVLFLLAGIIGRVWQQGLSPWKEWLRVAAVLAIIIALAIIFADAVQRRFERRSGDGSRDVADRGAVHRQGRRQAQPSPIAMPLASGRSAMARRAACMPAWS